MLLRTGSRILGPFPGQCRRRPERPAGEASSLACEQQARLLPGEALVQRRARPGSGNTRVPSSCACSPSAGHAESRLCHLPRPLAFLLFIKPPREATQIAYSRSRTRRCDSIRWNAPFGSGRKDPGKLEPARTPRAGPGGAHTPPSRGTRPRGPRRAAGPRLPPPLRQGTARTGADRAGSGQRRLLCAAARKSVRVSRFPAPQTKNRRQVISRAPGKRRHTASALRLGSSNPRVLRTVTKTLDTAVRHCPFSVSWTPICSPPPRGKIPRARP